MFLRFHVNTIGTPDSQLVWLKNPGGLSGTGDGFTDWEQNILLEAGPDVFIEFIKLEAEGATYEVMVTSKLLRKGFLIYFP